MGTTEDREVELRRRLGDIARLEAELAADDFARRHQLSTEADAIRAELQHLAAPGLADAADEWAERAGRKGSHAHDPEVAKGAIASPGHGPG